MIDGPMDDRIEPMIVQVRADTRGFARDVAAMRDVLEGPLAAGADRAGRAIETSLARAIRTGRLGFEDLKRVALSVLAEIAAAALRSGIEGVVGARRDGGGTGAGGLLSALIGVIGAAGGAPGRATGGPVAPGRPYWVGERGPELFVPAASGRVEPVRGGGARDVRVAITINVPGNAPGNAAGEALGRSGRQVARAVRAALAAED